ncbi:MAG: DoxX family protein [Bacteroidales bacterium]|nr:DoxX family protein [Bacteroidales bacterium]
MIKQLRTISRIIAGLVFIFSGISKGIDPLGSMYKFIDYFTAFGFNSVEELSFFLGIVLCGAEFLIGFAILTNIRVREASWGLLIFMAGFTPLTLYLSIANPVEDCGCFGDAIHLTNWQTFYKNIFISIFVLIVFIERKKYRIIAPLKTEWFTLLLTGIVFILFVSYNYKYLPIVDFRPYKTGTNIMEDMTYPDNAPVDEYEVLLIYMKDGEKKEFTLENYPSDDTSWVFTDQKSTLISRGYTPPIYDFSLVDQYGVDLTIPILNDPGITILMMSTKLSDATSNNLEQGFETGFESLAAGINFYIVTSSSPDDISRYENGLTFLSVDETTLKTIVRANPGYLLLNKGVVIKKWSASTLPDKDNFIGVIENEIDKKRVNEGIKFALVMLVTIFISLTLNIMLKRKSK